jgi:hypothetical protein
MVLKLLVEMVGRHGLPVETLVKLVLTFKAVMVHLILVLIWGQAVAAAVDITAAAAAEVIVLVLVLWGVEQVEAVLV